MQITLALLAGFMIWTTAPSQLAAQTRLFTQTEVINAPACSSNSASQKDQICSCKAGFPLRSVWGSGLYTSDSDVCTAAVHAGVITSSGGTIETILAPTQASYSGSSKNGITTSKWGAYNGTSFYVQRPFVKGAVAIASCSVLPGNENSYTCSCAANAGQGQGVWGSGPYTADSNLCAAAQHSGVISAKGGVIKVLRTFGLKGYAGTSANGITTSSWNSFDSSFVFNKN